MIGYGDTIGIHLIDGHHLDMTDGAITTTVGVITTDGIIIIAGITGTMVIIMLIIIEE